MNILIILPKYFSSKQIFTCYLKKASHHGKIFDSQKFFIEMAVVRMFQSLYRMFVHRIPQLKNGFDFIQSIYEFRFPAFLFQKILFFPK